MSKDNTVAEQPGLGVRWPLNRSGDAAPLVLPSGQTAPIATWNFDTSGNPTSVVRPGGVTGSVIAVNASRALTAADNGNTLDCTAIGIALTIPSGVLLTLGVVVIPNGATTVVSSGGALLNGSTSTVTRDSAINGSFAVIPRITANSYVVTGN
jgi:hypothetical protein